MFVKPGARRRERPLGPEEVELVVVTKASYSVLDVLEETIRRTVALFPGYRVWVVVDEGSEGLRALEHILSSIDGHVSTVVVPKDYSKGRHKARAINYFIETVVDNDKWYVFLDDDSYPLDNKFLWEIGAPDSDALVYVGVLAPRRGKSLVAWVADSARYYHEISRNRVALGMLGKPVYGLHGELLIVHGSVLKAIGFETDSLAEDTWFAGQLLKRGLRVRQVSTMVSILSPNSVVDLWKQRARWNLGVLRDIVKGRYPPSLAAARGFDAVLWLAAPLLPLATASASQLFASILGGEGLAAAAVLLSLAGVVPHIIYPAVAEGVRGAAKALALLPLVLASLVLSPIYALARINSFTSSFIVIDKSLRDVAPDYGAIPTEGPGHAPGLFEAVVAAPSYRHEARWLR